MAAGGRNPRHPGAARLGADAQPGGEFLGRTADGISHHASAGRADHGEADTEGAGGDVGGGAVR